MSELFFINEETTEITFLTLTAQSYDVSELNFDQNFESVLSKRER